MSQLPGVRRRSRPSSPELVQAPAEVLISGHLSCLLSFQCPLRRRMASTGSFLFPLQGSLCCRQASTCPFQGSVRGGTVITKERKSFSESRNTVYQMMHYFLKLKKCRRSIFPSEIYLQVNVQIKITESQYFEVKFVLLVNVQIGGFFARRGVHAKE